jgi:hypothetical protein
LLCRVGERWLALDGECAALDFILDYAHSFPGAGPVARARTLVNVDSVVRSPDAPRRIFTVAGRDEFEHRMDSFISRMARQSKSFLLPATSQHGGIVLR